MVNGTKHYKQLNGFFSFETNFVLLISINLTFCT